MLARRHPRATWASHANLGGSRASGCSATRLFRRLDEIIRSGAEAALDAADEAAASALAGPASAAGCWAARGAPSGRGLSLFPGVPAGGAAARPGLRAARARPRGAARRRSAASSCAPTRSSRRRSPRARRFRGDLARFHDAQVGLGRDLLRHLDDEEDLVIPLLLERGEGAVLGGRENCPCRPAKAGTAFAEQAPSAGSVKNPGSARVCMAPRRPSLDYPIYDTARHALSQRCRWRHTEDCPDARRSPRRR